MLSTRARSRGVPRLLRCQAAALHLAAVLYALPLLRQLSQHRLAHTAEARTERHVQLLQLVRGARAQQPVHPILQRCKRVVRRSVEPRTGCSREVVGEHVCAVLAMHLQPAAQRAWRRVAAQAQRAAPCPAAPPSRTACPAASRMPAARAAWQRQRRPCPARLAHCAAASSPATERCWRRAACTGAARAAWSRGRARQSCTRAHQARELQRRTCCEAPSRAARSSQQTRGRCCLHRARSQAGSSPRRATRAAAAPARRWSRAKGTATGWQAQL
jgi:hypothetical protein